MKSVRCKFIIKFVNPFLLQAIRSTHNIGWGYTTPINDNRLIHKVTLSFTPYPPLSVCTPGFNGGMKLSLAPNYAFVYWCSFAPWSWCVIDDKFVLVWLEWFVIDEEKKKNKFFCFIKKEERSKTKLVLEESEKS